VLKGIVAGIEYTAKLERSLWTKTDPSFIVTIEEVTIL
jgi:hypothetical protein